MQLSDFSVHVIWLQFTTWTFLRHKPQNTLLPVHIRFLAGLNVANNESLVEDDKGILRYMQRGYWVSGPSYSYFIKKKQWEVLFRTTLMVTSLAYYSYHSLPMFQLVLFRLSCQGENLLSLHEQRSNWKKNPEYTLWLRPRVHNKEGERVSNSTIPQCNSCFTRAWPLQQSVAYQFTWGNRYVASH